jgi:hypothetical protein
MPTYATSQLKFKLFGNIRSNGKMWVRLNILRDAILITKKGPHPFDVTLFPGELLGKYHDFIYQSARVNTQDRASNNPHTGPGQSKAARRPDHFRPSLHCTPPGPP